MVCPVCGKVVQDSDSRIAVEARFLAGGDDTEFRLDFASMQNDVVLHRACAARGGDAGAEFVMAYAAKVQQGFDIVADENRERDQGAAKRAREVDEEERAAAAAEESEA